MISVFPFDAAHIKAVYPQDVLSFMSVLGSSNNTFTASICPYVAACIRAVNPSTLSGKDMQNDLIFMSVSGCLNNSFMASAWPFAAAYVKAVPPASAYLFGSISGLSSNIIMVAISPVSDALISAVLPDSSFAFISSKNSSVMLFSLMFIACLLLFVK